MNASNILNITGTCICTNTAAMRAAEQADLVSALEDDRRSSLADRLSARFPRLFSIPDMDPDEFEAAYRWFLS